MYLLLEEWKDLVWIRILLEQLLEMSSSDIHPKANHFSKNQAEAGGPSPSKSQSTGIKTNCAVIFSSGIWIWSLPLRLFHQVPIAPFPYIPLRVFHFHSQLQFPPWEDRQQQCGPKCTTYMNINWFNSLVFQPKIKLKSTKTLKKDVVW